MNLTLTKMAQETGMMVGELAERLIKAGIEVNHYNTPIEDEEMGITAEVAKEIAHDDPGLLYIDSGDEDAALEALGLARCQCGQATGVRCEWVGPVADLVTVDWMPLYLRDSHAAAGNSGIYPHNGALRLSVTADCAAMLEDSADEAEA